MFRKSNNTNSSGSRTVTIIGNGSRVNGNIAFSGFLRVQGDILGDVTCDTDPSGTIVVHSTGTVTGAIKTRNLVVSGRVCGPVHASQSIEIHEGASVVGDAVYSQIDIHAGGILEGLLTPTTPIAGSDDQPKKEHRVRVLNSPAVNERNIPVTKDLGSVERTGGRRKFVWAAALIVAAAAAVLWARREPTAIEPPVSAVAPEPDSPAKVAPVVLDAPVKGDVPAEVPRATAKAVVSPAPEAIAAESKPAALPSPSDVAETDPGKMVTVQGLDSDKPANVFFVASKDAAVLARKPRNDTADGTHIDLARGARVRITIADDEVFRIVKGREVSLFYQGRKVAAKTIESGAWISFVPQLPGGPGDTQ